jgi:hypothetical protein
MAKIGAHQVGDNSIIYTTHFSEQTWGLTQAGRYLVEKFESKAWWLFAFTADPVGPLVQAVAAVAEAKHGPDAVEMLSFPVMFDTIQAVHNARIVLIKKDAIPWTEVVVILITMGAFFPDGQPDQDFFGIPYGDQPYKQIIRIADVLLTHGRANRN